MAAKKAEESAEVAAGSFAARADAAGNAGSITSGTKPKELLRFWTQKRWVQHLWN